MKNVIRFHGPKDVRFEKVEDPEQLSPHDAEIKVDWCGICGSDLHTYQHNNSVVPLTKPNIYSSYTGPCELGHEFAGVVTRIGSNVTKVAVGDKCAVCAPLYCGECASCKEGFPNTCVHLNFYGYAGLSGGLAERAVIKESHLVKLPGNVDTELGALAEPLSVAWHAIKQANFKQGKF